MDASPGSYRRWTGLFILMPCLFVLWPSLFILEGLAIQDHRGSFMVDYSHLELFHGVGRGAHRHDDRPVTVEVMGVNVLQLLHKFRQHGGNRGTPLVSSLSGRLSEEVDQSNQKTLALPVFRGGWMAQSKPNSWCDMQLWQESSVSGPLGQVPTAKRVAAKARL